MRQVRIEHKGRAPMTVNALAGSKRGHWSRADEVAYWREMFGWEAKALRLEPFNPPVHVLAIHLRKSSREVDMGAALYAAKASIDSLVDVKLLPDDGPRYVTRLSFEVAEPNGADGLALVVTEV